jgi:hypothetical protein
MVEGKIKDTKNDIEVVEKLIGLISPELLRYR